MKKHSIQTTYHYFKKTPIKDSDGFSSATYTVITMWHKDRPQNGKWSLKITDKEFSQRFGNEKEALEKAELWINSNLHVS